MNYGYFNSKEKEYVITRPDTPSPWTNFLGFLNYGALITNNAAGYSFEGSPAAGRLLRFQFNAPLSDLPGRYLYVRDDASKDYWSASWQPVGKNLSSYKSVCRHGTGYTIIESAYAGICTETLYLVPLHERYEIWRLRIRNTSAVKRDLSIFGYAEFTNDNNEIQDTINLQYTQNTSRTYYKKNMIVQSINELQSEKDATASSQGGGNIPGKGIYRFFGVSGAEVVAWEGSREVFMGCYRSYRNPVAVERGRCSNSLNYTGNSCGGLELQIELSPGEQKEFCFVFGNGDEKRATPLLEKYGNALSAERDLQNIKDFWHSLLDRFQVDTPDPHMNEMLNTWHPYQCFINFFWSRSGSLVYRSMRNGYGYRDTMGDIQGIMHLDHELAGDMLRMMLSGQVSNGGALPLVCFDHRAGSEPVPGTPEYVKRSGCGSFRCDDSLWLFQVVPQYINESGNLDFINEEIQYSDQGTGTVYKHLKKALEFSLARLGKHGLVLGLESDWNDCLRLGESGESVFASFQLYLALNTFGDMARHLGNESDSEWAFEKSKRLFGTLQDTCYDNDQFVRAITSDGTIIGLSSNTEANLWLNPQSWAVISGVASKEQAETILSKVHRRLDTEYGAILMDPPVKEFGLPIARMILYLPGIKENSGVFTQSQSYLILAESMAGNGNRAWEYYNKCNPAVRNDEADRRIIEPYVYNQYTEGIHSPFHGRSHGHWITGSSTTIMLAVVEGILGIKARKDGLSINPCIPGSWKEFKMKRVFRNKIMHIRVFNPEGIESGIKTIMMNDECLDTDFIPESKMKKENDVMIIMGKRMAK